MYNVLERLLILEDGEILGTTNLPADFFSSISTNKMIKDASATDLPAITNMVEREIIERVLQETNYRKSAAAKKTGNPTKYSLL